MSVSTQYLPMLFLLLLTLTSGCSPYSGSSLLVEVTAKISGEVVPDEEGRCPGPYFEAIEEEGYEPEEVEYLNTWVDGGYHSEGNPDGKCTIEDDLVIVARDEVDYSLPSLGIVGDNVLEFEITPDMCSTGGEEWEYGEPIAGVLFTVEPFWIGSERLVPDYHVGEYVNVEWTARMKSLHTDWTWQPAAQQILGNDRLLILGNICPDGSKQ